jgi:hypothetical protein
MSLHEEFNQKQIRTITRDINLIFSRKAKGLSFPKTIEEIKEIGFFSPTVEVNNNEVFLSNEGRIALRRICDFTSQSRRFQNLLNCNDIFQGVLSEIQRWLNDGLIPDVSEFINSLDTLLSDEIKNYVFFCRVDGISLGEVFNIVIGNRNIKAYENETLSGISNVSDSIKKAINKEYDDGWVIVGTERGSQSIAQDKFYHNAELSLSILRMYSCAFYSQAIHRINIRLINDCAHSYGPASTFGWTESEKSLIFTKYFKSEQDFEIDAKLLNSLSTDYFFEEISELIDKENRNRLEDAVVKSLFWIGEAQKDRSNPSAWVKLWSCLECFFTLGADEITEHNARGIASILVYGGFSHEKYDDYEQVKKKIKKYYQLRSKIVHHAEYTHIDKFLLEDLSFIVAWVIIGMISLVHRGYKTFADIQEQVERLDRIHNAKP